MKIMLVANTDWYLYNFRLELARFLEHLGHEVILVSPQGEYSSQFLESGFNWYSWNVGRRTINPFKELSALRQLGRIFRTEKPDLVHLFTLKPVLYGSLAAQWNRVPAVVNTLSGLGYVFLEKRLRGRILRQVVLALFRLAFRHPNKAVIFENSDDRETFIRWKLVSPSISHVVPGAGVDLERFAPSPQPGGMPLVILPSRMLVDKGVVVMAEAARLLKGRIPVRIALVGMPDPGNPATVSEEVLRSWEAEEIVEWWGFQSDMPAVFRQSHIVTLPSFGEGLPTALIEAAASARPVITTDVPGCRDVIQVGITGLLVPPDDPIGLADAIERLVLDPALRQRMGTAGRALAADRFQCQAVNEQTAAIYAVLAG